MGERRVLVITGADDPTADLVITELNSRGVPVLRLDPGGFPHALTVTASFGAEGMGGHMETSTGAVDVTRVRSVYWRRPSPYSAPEHLDVQDGAWVQEQSRWGLGGVLACVPGALYVNHPWHNRDAESKPAQLAAAARCGFLVPPTLVTNDPQAARAFTAEHAPVVYKPLWNSRYNAEDGTGRVIWVRPVRIEELDGSVASAAHLFQAQIDKIADIRLTAVGDRLFAVRIDGAAGVDWRADYSVLTFTPVPVPDEVASAVRSYLTEFGLVFGAFDFALRANGGWVMLECNPNGQWAFLDPDTVRGITMALADLLEKSCA